MKMGTHIYSRIKNSEHKGLIRKINSKNNIIPCLFYIITRKLNIPSIPPCVFEGLSMMY